MTPHETHLIYISCGSHLLLPSLLPCCLRLARYITATHPKLASNAVVNSLFGRISTCRIAFPLLDARSDPGIQLLLTMQSPISLPEVCQCPQRAYFHFYNLITLELPSALQVSMPSTGLLPFLQKI